MTSTRDIYDDQTALWNGPAGHIWVEQQHLLDTIFAPLLDPLLDAVRVMQMVSGGHRILDVGCGTGTTTLAVAKLLGASGHCTGIDISGPMLEAARAQAEREGLSAEFVHADAQTYPFAPASFDAIISQKGVMFFSDPVAAFSNLRRAAAPGAMLRCIVWRSGAENPFMTAAERAAAPLLPDLPVRRPGGPGQFAFADRDHVSGILTASGWEAIEIHPANFPCAFPDEQLTACISRLGPVGLALAHVDEALRRRVVETVRAAFAPYVSGDEVRFTAACWIVSARAPGGRT
jgi:SAM-dependent methyltransferase